MPGTTGVNHADAFRSGSTLVHLLRWRSAHQGGRRAFTFTRRDGDDEVHVTYQDLDHRARAIAVLLQREARAGDRVLFLYQPGLEYVAAFLGCLYADVVAVPGYPPNPRLQRTLTIVRDACPKVVLTTRSIVPIGEQLAAKDSMLAAARWVATDTVEDGEAALWREPAIAGDTLAFLQYTSGSTTTPPWG